MMSEKNVFQIKALQIGKLNKAEEAFWHNLQQNDGEVTKFYLRPHFLKKIVKYEKMHLYVK